VTARRRYYRGRNLVTMRDVAAGQNRVYHFDHQGTTQCLTDQTGAVTDRFAADAWGVQVKRTGTSINRHWHIGRLGYYQQADQSNEYVRLRWLQVRLGLWSSRDPDRLNEPGGSSYTYTSNRPGWLVDPSGAAGATIHHFLVGNSTGWEQIRARHQGAVRIWSKLAPGQVNLSAVFRLPVLPEQLCICIGGNQRHLQTVNIKDWAQGGSSLARLVTRQWLYEDYRITPCDAEIVVWTYRNPDLPRTFADTVPTNWQGQPPKLQMIHGFTFWWEANFAEGDTIARHNQAGVLAHELGHGLFSLGHDACGLMYGYIQKQFPVQWTAECLAKKSARRLSAAWAIVVPPIRVCEGHVGMYGIECLNEEGSGSNPDTVPPFAIVHKGPCLIPGADCCHPVSTYPCPRPG
jgi:hypothetical protein